MGNRFFDSFESLGKKYFSEKVKNFSNLVGPSEPKRPTEMEKKKIKMGCSFLALEVRLDA